MKPTADDIMESPADLADSSDFNRFFYGYAIADYNR